MMKFFHLGDLHIGKYLMGESLLEDQEYILGEIGDRAEELRPDFIIIAGDIFDRSVPREDAVKIYGDLISRLVLELKIPVYAISGNHDSALRLSGMNTLLKKAGYHIEGTLSKPLTVECAVKGDEKISLYFLPFKEAEGLRNMFRADKNNEERILKGDRITDSEVYTWALKEACEDPGKKILIAHNYFTYGEEEPEISDSERRLSIGGEDLIRLSCLADFDYVALGHLHRPQKVGKEYIRYAGSPLKYSLSEINNRSSFPFVTVNPTGETVTELIPLSTKRDIRILEGSFDELLSSSFTDKKDDFFHIILNDPLRRDDAYLYLQKIYPHIIRLEYANVADERAENLDTGALESMDIKKLFTDFFSERMGRSPIARESEIIEEILKEVEE